MKIFSRCEKNIINTYQVKFLEKILKHFLKRFDMNLTIR